MPIEVPFSPELMLAPFQLPAALPGTAQWISPYPDGSPGRTFITSLYFVAAAQDVITIHFVPPGSTAVAANRFATAMPVVPGGDLEFFSNEEQMYTLPAGYSIFFFAGIATNVNCFFWGKNQG